MSSQDECSCGRFRNQADIDYLRRAIKSKDPPAGSERPPRIKRLSRLRILSKEVFIRELILNSDVGSNSFLWNRCLSRDKTNSGSNSETKEVTRTTSKPVRLTLFVSSRDLYLRTWRAWSSAGLHRNGWCGTVNRIPPRLRVA